MRYWRCIRLRGIEMPTMLGFHRSDSWPERWALLEQLPRYTCGLAAAGYVGTVTKCIYWKWRRNKFSGAGVVENSSGRKLKWQAALCLEHDAGTAWDLCRFTSYMHSYTQSY